MHFNSQVISCDIKTQTQYNNLLKATSPKQNKNRKITKMKNNLNMKENIQKFI